MLKVLGRLSSINVRKVVWTCAELGVPFEREDWGAGYRDPNSEEFRARNPNALVPVIEDEGFVLWESSAIMRYLARKYDGLALLGEGLEEQALVDQWMGWQASDLSSAWGYAVRALIRKLPGYDNVHQLESSIAAWTDKMVVLDAQLGRTGSFVTGQRFSLADIVIGLSVQRWYATKFDKPDLANVAAYFERLQRETELPGHGLLDFP